MNAILIALLCSCASHLSKGVHQSTTTRPESIADTDDHRNNSFTTDSTAQFLAKKEFISYSQQSPSKQNVSRPLTGDALMPGDQIEISLMEKLPLSQEKRVEIKRIDDNGEIFIYPSGTLKLSGLSLTEARNLIEKNLQNYIISPLCEISIIKREYDPHIFVFGEVMKPGSIPFKGGNRLLDVLSATGGTTQSAYTSGIKVVRLFKDSVGIFTINLNDILKKGRIENNLYMQDQDIVYIPKSILSSASDILGKLSSVLPWYYFINNF